MKKVKTSTRDKGEETDTERRGATIRTLNPKKGAEGPTVPKHDNDLLPAQKRTPPWAKGRTGRESKVIEIAEVHEE